MKKKPSNLLGLKMDKCKECQKLITLFRIGADNYKWLSNPKDLDSWKCNPTAEFPVRSHTPAKE